MLNRIACACGKLRINLSQGVLLIVSVCLPSQVVQGQATKNRLESAEPIRADAKSAEATFGDKNAELRYFRSDFGLSDSAAPLPNDLANDATLLWRSQLAPGHSSPCVCGDSIFLTTFKTDSNELATVCLNRQDGSLRWQRRVQTDFIEPVHLTGSPASASPAADGESVYSFFGSYGLMAYDWHGQPIWELPLGPFQDEFGAASSPILLDDKIILNEDHDINSFIMAVDRHDGRIVWKRPRDDATRSYSTPLVLERSGRKEILIAGSLQIAAYDPDSGEKLWWYDGISRIVDCTPTVQDGVIYFASWTPGGDVDSRISMEGFEDALTSYDKDRNRQISREELPADSPVMDRFFRIDLDQNGGLDQTEWERHAAVFAKAQNVAIAIEPGTRGSLDTRYVRWSHNRGLPTVPSSVAYSGVLTMVKDSGIVTVLDCQTGKQLQQFRAGGQGNYYASLVAGDGKVYMISERGVLSVIKAGPDAQLLSTHDFAERVMASPVIRDGKLYVRTESALYCFAKKK